VQQGAASNSGRPLAIALSTNRECRAGQHGRSGAADRGLLNRLCPPRHPQTNGLVERFNGRISEVVQQTQFKSAAELEATLTAYCKTYNHHIPQRSLDHRSPVEALQAWQVSKPHLFKRAVYKQAGLDT